MSSFLLAAADFDALVEDSLFPFVTLLFPFLASCWAKYCRRLISKSGSLRYSSSELVRPVGACFNFGISSLVEFSYVLAILKYSTTWFVCLAKVLYIPSARFASYFDISK